jgi:hypothetical protein
MIAGAGVGVRTVEERRSTLLASELLSVPLGVLNKCRGFSEAIWTRCAVARRWSHLGNLDGLGSRIFGCRCSLLLLSQTVFCFVFTLEILLLLPQGFLVRICHRLLEALPTGP